VVQFRKSRNATFLMILRFSQRGCQ
jgi:hypothetical protein